MAPGELARRLAEQIWAGEARVGARLEPERRLAIRFAVSRPTVRAALRQLSAQGLIRVVRGRRGGAVVLGEVVPPSLLPETATAVGAAALLEARRALEPAVACLAAERASAGDLEALAAAVEEQRHADDGWAADLQRDARFHLLIARAARSPSLEAMLRGLHRDLYRARFADLRAPHSPRLLAEIHERTLTALRSRDRARIESDLAEHLAWLERVAEGGQAPAGEAETAVLSPG